MGDEEKGMRVMERMRGRNGENESKRWRRKMSDIVKEVAAVRPYSLSPAVANEPDSMEKCRFA